MGKLDMKIDFDRNAFLSALSLCAEKYGLDMATDVDIDLANFTISVNKDMELYEKINLIADIEEISGGLRD